MARTMGAGKKGGNINLTEAAKFRRQIGKEIAAQAKNLQKLVNQMGTFQKNWNRISFGNT